MSQNDTKKSERSEGSERSERSKLIEVPYHRPEPSGNIRDYIPSGRGVGKKIISTSDKKLTEEQVVAICTKYLRSQGWEPNTVFTGGIPLGNGRYATNPCKGIPDCIAINRRLGKTIWIEYKKSHGGIVSQDQAEWHKMLKAGGQVVFVVNSLQSLKEQLDNEALKGN